MDPSKTCSQCNAWSSTDGKTGQCRRFTPTADLETFGAIWPVTERTDGCLQFKAVPIDPEPGEEKRPRGRPAGLKQPCVLESMQRMILSPMRANHIFRLVVQDVPIGQANFYRILGKLVEAGDVFKADSATGSLYSMKNPMRVTEEVLS